MAGPSRRILDRHPGGRVLTDEVTVIGPRLHFKGEIRAPGAVVVAGHVDGPIVGGDLVRILPGGVVKGSVRGESVLVEGSVEGTVHATEAIEVSVSGRVRGDVNSTRVAIGEGSLVKGKVKASDGPVVRFHERRNK